MQGNSKGDCYVWDAASGERLAHVAAERVAAPVRACGLSEDCRHLLAVLGRGFVFRFEYLGPLAPPADGEEAGGKENSSAAAQQQGAAAAEAVAAQ